VLALFFLSGAAALIYEIAWSRLIGLQFGHTAHAASVTLGAYFAGMAFGSLLAARWVHRVARPLHAYAGAELAAAGWALATPALVGLLARVEAPAALGPSTGAAGLAARGAAAVLVLLPATVALGATLPAVAQHLAAEGGGERRVALAYGVNTLGAVGGAVFATAFSILQLGVRGSNALAAAISGLCGLLALALAARGEAPRRAGAPAGSAAVAGLWFAVAAVSGFCTLALEVLYARLFSLVLHNSTYTFGAVLAVFLVCLGAASVLVARRRRTTADRDRLGIAAALAAVAIVASVLVFAAATRFEPLRPAGGFTAYLFAVAALVALVVAPPALCLGVLLPLSWSAARGAGGATVGRLAATSTAAGAVGSIAAAFLLLPWLDLWWSFGAVAAAALGLTAVLWRGRWTSARRLGLATGAAVVLVFAVTFARTPHGGPRASGALVVHESSAYGWTDVIENRASGHLVLRQNLHDELGGSAYAWHLAREGHLPLLLHPRPRRVLFLGLGTGITAGAALRHPEVERVDVVELVPPVARAARRFARFNHHLAADPRARVAVDDARHFLARAEGRYDVIVSDLFVPWHSQTGSLFTVEHDRAALGGLRAGGLFCQWLMTSDLGARELDLVADSLASVFPYVTLWRADADRRLPLLALVGSAGPLVIDRRRTASRMARLDVPTPLAAVRFDRPEQLLDLFVGRWRVRRPDRLNTDDRPRLEFLAPRAEGDFTFLLGERLLRYERETLAKLPREGLEVTGDLRPGPPARGGAAAPSPARPRR
jgi:spermidine synthase